MNNKISKIIIACLTLVILFLVGIIIYDNNLENSDNNDNNTDIGEKIDTNSDIVTLLMDKVYLETHHFTRAEDVLGYFYLKDKYTADNIDNRVKLELATKQLFKNINFNYDTVIEKTNEEMHEEMVKIFGKDIQYSDEDVTIVCKTFGTYDKNTQKYTFKDGSGCGSGISPFVKEKVESAIKYKGRIEIIVKIYCIIPEIVEGVGTDSYRIINNIHKNPKDEEIIGVLEDMSEDIFKKYSDKLDSYKYTFCYENGNYYFNSVEKVKNN